MKILIKNGHVIDPSQQLNGVMDVVISGDQILRLCQANQEQDREYDQILDATGLVVAPGLIDVHVHFREPGFTYKEDIKSGARAAAKGGFTTVVCMANTKPPVDNVETLEQIIKEGEKTGIRVLTCATVTKGIQGRELTDMSLLKEKGAAGFTDDGIPIMDGKLLYQAMELAKSLDLPLSFHEEDPAFITNNGVNQGETARELGLLGSPAVAEDSLVARDCMIALHAGATVNIQHISSKNAVAMVRLAKELGADVWAEVTPHHFTLTEQALKIHGALAKMNPPLRSEEDRMALIKGLQDGTIDIIATDHAPHSREEKTERPLEKALSGIIGLETALALGITHLVGPGYLTMDQLIDKMSCSPARLYRLPQGCIKEGADADLVLIDMNAMQTVVNDCSKSDNSPFTGQSLRGQVKATICKGKIVYREESYV